MADATSAEVALLPIHPAYAKAILDGAKRVEFRRRRFARPVEYVVIYATQPIGRVLGFFRVDAIEEASPDEIWTKYEKIGGIGATAFQDYYRGAEQAVAIRVDVVRRLQIPLRLEDVDPTLTVPQNFVYLSRQAFHRLSSNGEWRNPALS